MTSDYGYRIEELESYSLDILEKINAKYGFDKIPKTGTLPSTTKKKRLINNIIEHQDNLFLRDLIIEKLNNVRTNTTETIPSVIETNLPLDVLRLIAYNLEYQDLINLCNVNKNYKNICINNVFRAA